MSDFDFGDIDVDGEFWGDVTEFLILNADWLPTPALLGGVCAVGHYLESTPHPFFHGTQDIVGYYAGITVAVTGQALMGKMDKGRSRLAAIALGTALCVGSYFSDNYAWNMFDSGKEKAPTEQKAPAPAPAPSPQNS